MSETPHEISDPVERCAVFYEGMKAKAPDITLSKGNKSYTIDEMILEVRAGSEIGRMLLDLFLADEAREEALRRSRVTAPELVPEAPTNGFRAKLTDLLKRIGIPL